MADYYQLKNQNIFNPPANTNLGNSTNRFDNAYVQDQLLLGNVSVTGSTVNTPKVNTITYPGDDTAADTAGGQTITLTGSGFLAGASVLINGSAVGVVSVVNTTTITFISPANSAGSYVVYVINPDAGTAISIPGIQYSGTPNWTTAAGSLGSIYETASFNQTVTATGDAPITYSIASGSIPPGATFNSNGTITGTSQLLSSSTTYSFTVTATDAQLQDTNRAFSLTINPDVVTWSSPANGTTYTSATNSAISNVVLSATSAVGSGITYTANTLPTGLSLSGANISGTPTVGANTSSLLTATANTTSESANITINWVISVSNDIYFEYNTLLIPGASTTFVDDASTNNFAVTINGDTKPNSFNPYTPGYYSNYFDGTGDYLSTLGNSSLVLGTEDFTIECWFNVNSTTNNGLLHLAATVFPASVTGVALYVASNNISMYCAGAASPPGGAISTGVWYHVAMVRYNGVTKLYLNGTYSSGAGSVTDTTNYTGSALAIGGYYNATLLTNGYISNIRIVKGTALYITNFTPSTTPLTAIANTSLLTCQSNRFIDNSTNNFTLTVNGNTSINSFDPFVPNSSYSSYGSGYFDGTGDYLTYNAGTSLNFAGDFTVEAWVYRSTASLLSVIDTRTGANYTNIMCAMTASGTMDFIANDGTNRRLTTTDAATLGAWNHLAWVRSGTTVTAYLNGVSAGTVTVTGTLNVAQTTAWIGSVVDPIYGQGYLSNLRIVNGTAVYTTAFTPPSAPLTAIANTSLLTLQNNQSVNNNVFLDNSSNNFFVTRNGNTTQGTFSPYGGNWSNYFDGTGDYLNTPSNAAFGFGTGDFTIEGWFYFTGTMSTYQRPWWFGDDNDNLEIFSSVIRFGGASETVITGPTAVANIWYHIAYTRQSGSGKLFVNGTQVGSTTASSYNSSARTFTLMATSGGANPSTGYVSNFRIIKGTALYTTTFTPSTTPLTVISGTSLLTCQSNRIVDNSINNFTITKNGDVSIQRFSPFNPSSVTPTSYSGYFDGSGDYLTLPSNQSQFSMGTGNFTVEMWVYISSLAAARTLYDTSNSGDATATGRMLIQVTTGGVVQFATGAASVLTSGGTLAINTWYHIAVTKASGSTRIYVNGVQVNTTYTDSNTYTVGTINRPIIGVNAYDNSTSPMLGYISNLRVVKGVAVYTGAFTVPTSPLAATQSSGTNIAAITGTSTSLLTLQSTTFIDNSSNNFAITAAGNSQPTQQNPFGYTSATTEGYTVSTIGGSGYFDGTGDYLTVPRSTLCIPGASQNFTIEAWVYSERAAGVTSQQIMGFHASGVSADWIVLINSSNYPEFYISATNTTITSSIIVNPYSWNHIAVVRKNTNSITIYVNGVAGVTATSASTLTGNGANPLSIGSDYNGANVVTKGYISNGRVVNGTALYTSNFVPPAAPLTAVQNTTLLTNMTSAGVYDAAMMNNMETVGDAKLSTAVSKFGGSSMSFDGTGDYMVGGAFSNPIHSIGSGDFTIEMWLYTNANKAQILIDTGTVGGSTTGIQCALNASGYPNTVLNNSIVLTSSILVSTTTWTHVAWVRSSGTLVIYVNGVSGGSVANSINISDTGLTIGTPNDYRDGSSTYHYNGYIDDLRITKGYARYTSNFTSPLQAFPTY